MGAEPCWPRSPASAGALPRSCNEAAKACNHVLQHNNESRPKQPDRESDLPYAVCEENCYEDQNDKVTGGGYRLSGMVAAIAITKAKGQGTFQLAKSLPSDLVECQLSIC